MTGYTGFEIAVVGLAGRFPGASDVDAFWANVLAGEVGVRRFTDEELDAAGVPEHRRAEPGFVPMGGALDGIEHFDAKLFGYSPRDAAVLDPQHRVFLECAWHALEHAGRLGDGEGVGVYASASINTYLLRHLLGNPAVPGGLQPLDLMLANDKDTLASRVSYHLDLTGPAITVQTACSSSLVTIHVACQALLGRDCDTALAGGVSIRPPVHEGYEHTEGGILAADGRCLPFDADAHGVVAGNGVAAVVLRRLEDALADGDTIHAVIKGTAVNNDGAGKVGFTAPSVTGQARVIRAAHELSEVDPSTIGYVEAHGTATPLGDPIEVAALTRAFDPAPASCALGSVKALIGHLDAAAGVAGFVKAAFAVRDGVVPPSPYFTTPNPETGLEHSPFFVNREALPWPSPRRAGVSGFGMGGTNAHAVLEEPPSPEPMGPARSRQLLVLSAATEQALEESRRLLAEHLAGDGPELADVAHTLRVGRRALRHRLAVVAGDRSSAGEALAGAWTGAGERGDVVFLFPGQGSQYAGMAAQLAEEEPVFRAVLDECDALLPFDLHEVLGDEERLARTRFTQPALFAVEYALAKLWEHWGVRPSAMLGHSVGEYVAACLAGVFSLRDALTLVTARGELMDALPAGAMLSVPLGADELELPGDVCLAAANAPKLSTVAGTFEAIDRFAATLSVTSRRLRTSHAFHSSMIDPMLAEFAARVRAVELREPVLPFVSNVSGTWITAPEATDPGYWVRHAREAVRFSEGLRTALAGGPVTLLEAGPGNVLTTLARQHDLASGGHAALGSLRHPREDKHDLDTVLAALGRLWIAGAPVDLAAVTSDERRRRVPLPRYPFEKARHWIDLPGTKAVAQVEAQPVAVKAEAVAEGDLAVVTGIWQELLGVARIGPHDDYFELGGHSLLATQILARITADLGVALPAGAIFEAPTPAKLVALLDRTRAQRPDEDDEFARLLAEIRDMSPEQLRAELDRERDAQEISQS
ncbi:Acyl transferase domain-containing protein [Lentzea fradiae]|uniref:Acyl transferase domain-containing protein n=1 Tax=Lentzea fradiae TaxID=200378 RepID=A0A1G7R6Q4_9PSEU|nr:type I polyketide synthase [Lentzea fradiae]SDG06471.1 Acyl transferase domain-containing protein [Lentzea fradiae]